MGIREILFILVVFASNIIEAITGFAGTLLAMPFSMVLIGLNDSKVILNVITMVIGISTGVKYVKYTNKRELMKIIAFMLIGMLIGMQLLGILPERIIMFIYGIVVLAVAINGYLLMRDVIIGNFTTYNLTLILILLIPLVIAIILGYKIQKVIEQKHFMRLTYVLLLISGTILLLQ
ncbi:sulfite exporter TauE/SafE family protein [Clostridium sp.]|uniref:sulfite exporter TauE/SafE family protein n=1 Tax=Clostridium sp. TaxID=1506 RepID=UPI0025C0CC58|nr:sulfite exporter TauE/SafE family protein [Clostridium sp.]